MASFLAELRRRNVFKVAVAYAIVGWLLVEVASTVFPILQIPQWAVALVTMLLLLGFPVALILSWAYEVTPEGIKKTRHVPLEESITHVTGQTLNYVITGLVVLVLGFVVIDQYVLEEDSPEASVQESAQEIPESAPFVAAETENEERDLRSIAVLPFENRSPREEDQFFVDGIHDDILTQLDEPSRPVMRASAGLHADQTWSSVSKEIQELGALDGLAQDLAGFLVYVVHLNDVLRKVDTDGHGLHSSFLRLAHDNLFGSRILARQEVSLVGREALIPLSLVRPAVN